jgi:hypothetical protein
MARSRTSGGQRMQDENDRQRRNWLALAAVVGGIGLLIWLTLAFLDWNKLQTCVSEGRRNCAERVYSR